MTLCPLPSHPTSSSPVPPDDPSAAVNPPGFHPLQIDTLTDNIEAQVNSLKACIENICRTMEINKSSAETLTWTIDKARDELHNTAQFINNMAEELTGVPSQIKDTLSTLPP